MHVADVKHIASWSGGKDSTATIILAREKNEPLDLIIFSEVMFDEEISGEFPEHIDFIKNVCIPTFKKWGYETKILCSEKTYLDYFNRIAVKGKNVGKKKGFPMVRHCGVLDECKMPQIRRFWKTLDCSFTQYVGIAIDEPKRLDRIVQTANQVSLLQKYKYTEEMARDLCEKYDLLSPIYKFAHRGGCWFCPNSRDCQLRHLRKNHRNLWDKLLELENTPDLIGDKWNTLTRTSLHDKEEQFFWEEQQMTIWDYLAEQENYKK